MFTKIVSKNFIRAAYNSKNTVDLTSGNYTTNNLDGRYHMSVLIICFLIEVKIRLELSYPYSNKQIQSLICRVIHYRAE